MEEAVRRFDRNYIDGAWRETSGDAIQVVTEAAHARPLAEVRLASKEDAKSAIEAAATAAGGWAQSSPAERSSFLDAIATGLEVRQDEIARDIAREVGMPLKLAGRIQIAAPIAAWKAYAGHARSFEWQETVGNSLVERVPAGVVVAITPWNYPLHQMTAKVAAALAAGCTVVLKPSEIAPLSAYALAEVIEAAGLPKGVFNLVVGSGAEIGDALVAHSRTDVVSFTGSTTVGGHVASLAARSIKRISLELGGKSAGIVLEGADLQMAVKATVASCFLNSGQTCSAITRLLVPEERYDEAARIAAEIADATVVGDPLDSLARMGPLVSARQRDRVLAFIRDGLASGAELVAGGPDTKGLPETGFFVRPTVLGKVPVDSVVAREEIFGPVLTIITYRTVDEALTIANSTGYGLAAAVWAADDRSALPIAQRMRAGQVDINGAPFNLQAPFGGFGRSGIGRENGRFGIEEFVEVRSIQQRRPAT